MGPTDKQTKPLRSSSLRFGKRTFFFDVNLSSKNTKYLKITESRFVEEGQDRKRSSFVIFPEEVKDFHLRFSEMIGHLA